MDKALHIGGSAILYTVSHSIYEKNNEDADLLSCVTVLSIGIIKELMDKKFDWGDIWADILGIELGRVLR